MIASEPVKKKRKSASRATMSLSCVPLPSAASPHVSQANMLDCVVRLILNALPQSFLFVPLRIPPRWRLTARLPLCRLSQAPCSFLSLMLRAA